MHALSATLLRRFRSHSGWMTFLCYLVFVICATTERFLTADGRRRGMLQVRGSCMPRRIHRTSGALRHEVHCSWGKGQGAEGATLPLRRRITRLWRSPACVACTSPTGRCST